MTSLGQRRAAAREIVEMVSNIPVVLRAITIELRQPNGYDVTPAHIRLLALLADGACNLSELAERQAVSLPTMSNSISVLVERGWVKRTPSCDDRRMVCLELTPTGRAVLVQAKRQAERRVAALLAPLSQDEYEMLRAGLSILRRTFAPLTHSE